MKKGFTLVELLAVIVLLTLIFALVYPNILEISEKQEGKIDEAKKALINSAVLNYMNANLNQYPQSIGKNYCIKIETLDSEALIPVDVSDVLENYNYVRVRIGANNSYSYNYIQAESEEACLNS